MTLAEIKNSDWSLSVTEPGKVVEGVESIKQRIDTILKTPKGSVPLNNAFGCDILLYVDKPLTNVAAIKAEVLDALETWETKAIVNKIISTIEVGKLTLAIYFSVVGQESSNENTVVIFNT